MSKTILVTGATGTQGGSVVDSLLKDKHKIRALTRKPDSDSAKALKAKGVEVVKGDLSDIESIKAALKGVDGAFLVTQFWESFDADKEFQEAKQFIDAAKEAGVKHLVASLLHDCSKLSKGKYSVPHFDGKGKAEEYLKSQTGLNWTIVELAAYFENFLGMMAPQKQADGSFVLAMPLGQSNLAAVSSQQDTGPVVASVFANPEKSVGKTISIAGTVAPVTEYCNVLSKELGIKVNYYPMSVEDYRKLPFPGADDIGSMFGTHAEFSVPCKFAVRFEGNKLMYFLDTVEQNKEWNAHPTTWEEFVKANKNNFSWAK
jgi:uncharacterized protein YbjT (DUF2867 family)